MSPNWSDPIGWLCVAMLAGSITEIVLVVKEWRRRNRGGRW